MINQRFGHLTVISRVANVGKNIRYQCDCDCGHSPIVYAGNLTSGRSTSCNKCKRRTHGLSNSPEYEAWKALNQRCTNPKHPSYKDYGGRGISVEYQSFEEFYNDVGPRPSPIHQLDREENSGNYEPDNCRWVIPEVNTSNKRDNVYLEYKGKRLTIAQWSRELNIKDHILRYRYYKKLPIEEILNANHTSSAGNP